MSLEPGDFNNFVVWSHVLAWPSQLPEDHHVQFVYFFLTLV